MAITTLRIFPPIGIARLGDSADFFIGPERPRDSTPPPGGYRDASCRIKRQAARFRIYAYDESDVLILDPGGQPREITVADGTIAWTVELANTKSSWQKFEGLNAPTPLRNAAVQNRVSLEITPGPRTLNGVNQTAAFDTGTFLGKLVPLGEMRTDAAGRCLVLGGFGSSASVPPGLQITSYANNNGWHDDISDGPVRATVTIGGQVFQAVPAWVICAPTKFAPAVESMTSLYDTLEQKAVDAGTLPAPGLPSLTRDIYPVLRRTVELGAVSNLVIGHHSFNLANPQNVSLGARQSIVGRLRDPANPAAAGAASMPVLLDDNAGTAMTLTRLQYRAMQGWLGQAGVDWVDDWAGSPGSPANITPDGLTRAALEPCVGGAFFPGIEAGWRIRDVLPFVAPFRLDAGALRAGDVTKQMAVPWQADFLLCRKEAGHPNPNPPPATADYLWWPAQRPDDVLPQGGATMRAWTQSIASSYAEMVTNWSRLGFVVRDASGQLVESERRLVCRGLIIVLAKPVFGAEEVATALALANPAVFADALNVIAEGFLPAELGVTAANPTPAQLLAWAPAIAFHRSDASAVPDMTAVPTALLLQNATLPANQTQRFTFVYRVEFASLQAFSVGGVPVEAPAIEARASKTAVTPSGNQPFAALAHLSLFQQPNPYMVDGAVTWLSTDLRVFKVTEGESPFGGQFGAMGNTPQAALAFIGQAVNAFNAAPAAGHPFDTIATDANTAQLELSRQVNGQRIFNFAVAKVRYRAQVLQAGNLRVFFRLFTTAATGMNYDEAGTYRRSNSQTPVALLGVRAGNVVTMPCFGQARVDSATQSLATQQDPLNVRSLAPAGAATESIGYFGCWLDFNQTEARFPTSVAAGQENGPWTSGRLSLQELIRGRHQCLVAELWFSANPIDQGASPGASENLAQRNLVIAESDNPGAVATHTVQHTFEIRATRPQPTRAALLGHWQAAQRGHQAAVAAAAPAQDWFEPGPDELMIRWGSLPRTSRLSLYVPDLPADELLDLAGRRMDQPRLVRQDAHTIECEGADVSYLPLPEGRLRNSPALLSIELPAGVKRDQRFDATVHQVSGWPRTIVGSFQLHIPVGDKKDLLAGEVRKLSVLRHIQRAIPPDDPWHAVFRRYLEQIAARVDGFGGDSADVAPSPDGTGRDEAAERCARRATAFVGLVALTGLLAGLPGLVWLAVLAALAAAGAGWAWQVACRPGACRLRAALAVGLGVGAGALVLAMLVGLQAGWAAAWLGMCVVIVAVLLLWTWWRGCLLRASGGA